MTGPSLAPLIIPIAGTLFLSVWLALVFYAGRLPRGAAGHPAPGHRIPAPAALAAPRLPGAHPTDMAASANTRYGTPRQSGDVRVIFEVER
ncbi:MAG: hypothetical protein ABSA53_32875 [Streptosporangiaceae bacterium]|jgi:hypothetical protein